MREWESEFGEHGNRLAVLEGWASRFMSYWEHSLNSISWASIMCQALHQLLGYDMVSNTD